MNTKLSQYAGLARPPAPEQVIPVKCTLSQNTGSAPESPLSHNTSPLKPALTKEEAAFVKRLDKAMRKDRHYDCDCMSCRPWTS